MLMSFHIQLASTSTQTKIFKCLPPAWAVNLIYINAILVLTIFLHRLDHPQGYSPGKGLCRQETLFISPSMVICSPVNYSYVMEILEGQHNLTSEESHNTL